jgi:plasmid stability protein
MARTVLDQFVLRLPDGMRSRLAERAKINMRSMNSEAVMILASALSREGQPTTGESLQAHPAAADHDTALQGGPVTHG